MKNMFKKLLKPVIEFCLMKCGLIHWLVPFGEKWRFNLRSPEFSKGFFRKKTPVVQVLMYHRVNDVSDGFLPAMPVRVFQQHMRLLADLYRPISLREMLECLDRKDIPERAVVVTFDDGYRDNFTHAYPILCQYSIPATIFLATDAIGGTRLLWYDKIFYAFSKTNVTYFPGLGEMKGCSIERSIDRNAARETILNILRASSNEQRLDLVEEVLTLLDIPEPIPSEGVMLSWQEIRSMQGNGVHFGAHTVTHPILSKLPEVQIRKEVKESKRIIEDQLGTKVDTFAYPNGKKEDYNQVVKKILQEEGYQCAVTTIPGINTEASDPFALKRLSYWDEKRGMLGLRMTYSRCGT